MKYDWKKTYEQETGNAAEDIIPLYAGDRQGVKTITEEYVVWLETKITALHQLSTLGYLMVSTVEPAQDSKVRISGQLTPVTYIGNKTFLTDSGELVETECYNPL